MTDPVNRPMTAPTSDIPMSTETDPRWTAVCATGDILPDAGVCALVDGVHVAIFHVAARQQFLAFRRRDDPNRAIGHALRQAAVERHVHHAQLVAARGVEAHGVPHEGVDACELDRAARRRGR